MRTSIKRTVFISYYHGDQVEVNEFVKEFSNVFIPKTVGVKDGDFEFDSTNPQYIMQKIRENKLQDSTVTIVLVGQCTKSRRYVDWEIKASLQQGTSLPNGLIGINLKSVGNTGYAPERLEKNLNRDSNGNDYGYARYYTYPTTPESLREWIEDAFNARTERADKIINPNDMMKYNKVCVVHGVTH